jgi:hypothetical protein
MILFLFSVAYMLDTARVNGRTIRLLQKERQGPVPNTRQFAQELVRDLVTPHLTRRLQRPGLQTFVKVRAQCYLASGKGAPFEDVQPNAQPGGQPVAQPDAQPGVRPSAQAARIPDPVEFARKTRRCYQCMGQAPNRKAANCLKKVSSSCRHCQKAVCETHSLFTCFSCAEEELTAQLPVRDVPARALAPIGRLLTPPAQVMTPPARNIIPPTVVVTPSAQVALPPAEVVPPPARVAPLPAQVVPPPAQVVPPPAQVAPPPARAVPPPAQVVPPPARVVPPPARVAPPPVRAVPQPARVVPLPARIIPPSTSVSNLQYRLIK